MNINTDKKETSPIGVYYAKKSAVINIATNVRHTLKSNGYIT